MKIKRDWAGRATEITTDDGKKTNNFYLAYIDDVGVFNEEENIENTLLPFFIGASNIKQKVWMDEYYEDSQRKKELKDRVVQTPRDRWDQIEKDKAHPYDTVVQSTKDKDLIKEKKKD